MHVQHRTPPDAHVGQCCGDTSRSMDHLTYFTCTLGQAIQVNQNQPAPFETITEFLDYQAQRAPDRPAVGFPNPQRTDGEWGHSLYCRINPHSICIRAKTNLCTAFKKLHQYSLASADILGRLIQSSTGGETARAGVQTVALLCPSSIEFLFSWLGLMQLGYSVLLVASVHSSPSTPVRG